MAKFIWIGVGFIVLGAAVGGYVLNSGAPAVPKGGCPAMVSLAPYDADIVAFADFSALRSTITQRQLDALTNTPMGGPYREFVASTNFHLERDLDHILLSGSFAQTAGGALVLEGRFDQPKLSEFFVKMGGTPHHFESGDVFTFSAGAPSSPAGTFAVMFLGPNRLALTGGKGPETQMLVLADAAQHPDPALHEDLCTRTQRVSGAPFFVVGGVPKSPALALASMAAPKESGFTDLIDGLVGWDIAFWSDNNSVRMALEAQYDGYYDALKARFAFEKLRGMMRKEMANSKPSASSTASERAAMDAFTKNFAITLDGRYVRLATALNKSDIEKLASSAATAGQPAPLRW